MIRGWHVAVATFVSIALVVSLAIAGDVRVPGGLVVSNPPGVDFAGNVTPTTLTWPTGPVSFSIGGNVTLNCDSQGCVIGRSSASQQAMRIAPLIGQETAFSAIWTGASALAPTSGNYEAAWSASQIFYNPPTQNFAGGVVVLNTTSLTWASVAGNVTISESPTTTNNATAPSLTVQAPNETGTTSIGGPLVLTSGTGTSAAGPTELAVGGSPEFVVGLQATGGGPAGITLANTNNFSITAAVNTTFTPTPAQYINPLFTLTGTLSAAAVATIALPNVSSSTFWKFDISQVVFTSGTIKWQCNGGTASAGISSLTTTSEIVEVLCNGTRVAINQ